MIYRLIESMSFSNFQIFKLCSALNIKINKRVIVIAGPTAVGKTAVAIQLAKHFNTEIVSADSRQCYKELNIGVARPNSFELNQVPHHFIASHHIGEEVNAATFEQYALAKCEELFAKHDTIIMVGGTGLYIRAFCEGLDSIPAIDPAIRQQVMSNYEQRGIEWLTDQLRSKDEWFTGEGEMQNPQRMMRALEVMEGTGHSILSFRSDEKAIRDFTIIKTGLELSRPVLIERINKRVDEMIAHGLVDEVKSLLPFRHLNALQTVGYAEIFEYLDGAISLSKAIEKIKIATRQYAKRQMTWFKKDQEIKWFDPSNGAGINSYLALS